MIECEALGCCPLEFGLCACDLRTLADAFHPDADPRRRRFVGGHEEAERMGLVRARLRTLADQIGDHSPEDHPVADPLWAGLRCHGCAAPIS